MFSLTLLILLGKPVEVEEDEKLKQPSSKAGAKRRKEVGGDQESKVAKVAGDVSTSRRQPVKNANGAAQNSEASDLETKLEAQTKDLWALKDDLKKHVTTAELREMLEANGQDSTGSELDLRDRW